MTELTLSANRREAVVRGSPGFPCAAYFADIALFPASTVAWHWREEIELTMVVGGAARVRTPDGDFILRAGEGVFINAGALHAFDIVGNEGCRMIMLVLDHNMLGGEEESVFSRRYLEPLIKSSAVRLLPMVSAVDWQKEVLQCIREAFLIYDEGRYGFELMVRARLTEAIYHIVRNVRGAMREAEAGTEGMTEERVKQMLDFIHLHHAEPVTLAQIAQEANIGSRECLRAFQKTLGISPIAYLLRYRASVSAQMLIDGDDTIAEICFKVGFNSQSHYGQIFKRYFLCTPREYRERMRRL